MVEPALARFCADGLVVRVLRRMSLDGESCTLPASSPRTKSLDMDEMFWPRDVFWNTYSLDPSTVDYAFFIYGLVKLVFPALCILFDDVAA